MTVSTSDHWLVTGCVGIVIVAAILCPVGGSAVTFAGRPVTNFCLFRHATGINCPLCGLTRSVVALCHADLTGSWRLHRVGWIVYLYLLLQIPARLMLMCHLLPETRKRLDAVLRAAGRTAVAGVLANWILVVPPMLRAAWHSG